MKKIITFLIAFLLLANVCLANNWDYYGFWTAKGPSLTFSALTYDPTTFAMTGVLTGTGDITVSRTTTQYVLDSAGVYQAISANNPAWYGARYDTGVAYADDGAGSLLSPLPMLQVDPALTNTMRYSRDIPSGITAGNWTDSATPLTSAYNAVGLAGVASTATTLTRQSGTLALYIQQSLADITGTLRVFAKASGTSWLHLLATTANNYAQFNITNGTVGANSGGAGLIDTEINQVGSSGWYEILMEVSTGTTWRIYPFGGEPSNVAGPSDNLPGTVILGNVELFNGKTIAQVRGAGPIFTTTAAVTTGAETGTFDSANISDTSGLITFRFLTQGAQNLISTFAEQVGTTLQLDDGTTQDTVAAAVDTTHKGAIWWHGSTMGLCINGTCEAAVAYDGTILAGALDLFRSGGFVGQIGPIKIYGGGNATSYQTQAVTDTTP